MLTQTSPHRFLATTPPKHPWGGSPFLRTARGYDLPGFALDAYGLRWEHAAGVRQRNITLPDPFALCDLPCALWPHQVADVPEMVAGPWGEWAQVGLGKTLMVLSAFKILRDAGQVDGLIVLGPESASHAWVGPSSDAHTWGIESGLITDKVKKKGMPTTPILFCNYDKAWREPYSSRLLGLLRTRRYALVLDEAHLCTGPAAKRFAAVELWSRFAPYLWLLTGTPVMNYPDRLWAIWRLLTRDSTSYEQWCLWFRPDGRSWHSERLAQLGRYMKRFSRVRTKKEVAPHLPATIIKTIPVRLDGVQRQLYTKYLEKLAHPESDNERLGAIQKLLGVCSHPDLAKPGAPLVQAESKLAILLELLEGFGELKTVIWSWHPATLDWLARKLPVESVRYHGGTNEKERAAAVLRFNADPECKVFLGNPSAAGAGLNLPAGDVRVYWDGSFSSTQYVQSAGRIERGIKYDPKMEYRLVAENSVESYAWQMVEKKIDLAEFIFRGGPAATHHAKGIVARWQK